MATTLNDFLTPLKTMNVQIVIKDLEEEVICKIYADTVLALDEKLSARTVNRWDIVRNNLLIVYLNDAEETEIVAVDSVELNVDILSLKVGETETLIATVLPADATNQAVTWLSSDSNIATVEDGVVTAVAQGTATIVVTTDDGGHTAVCVANISAVEEVIPVVNISLSETALELAVGSESVQLVATIEPDNATDKTVSWGTSDELIANVIDGLVIPISAGTAIISAITNDGGFIATCSVTVTAE